MSENKLTKNEAVADSTLVLTYQLVHELYQELYGNSFVESDLDDLTKVIKVLLKRIDPDIDPKELAEAILDF